VRAAAAWRLACALLLTACQKWEAPSASYSEPVTAAPAPVAERAIAMAAPKGSSDVRAAMDDVAPTEAPQGASPQPPASARMVYYEGFARLRVDAPRKIADDAARIVTESGGFVEQLSSTRLTLRVPVARFKDLFKVLLGLGQVVDKAVSAQDVTEAFTALELRIETAKASRDRLIQLLAQAKTEREKLDLLREIQRLSLELETMESHKRFIASLASMSRITLELEERQREVTTLASEPIGTFAWIHELSPFKRDLALSGERLKSPVPEGFVALSDRKQLIAESADGATFAAYARHNVPKANTEFWAAAIAFRLAPEYAAVEKSTLGAFAVLKLKDRGDPAYVYWLAVAADGDTLAVIEAYFPDEAHATRHGPEVGKAIAEVKP
jgi:Domain of unknown function (DUF4349)